MEMKRQNCEFANFAECIIYRDDRSNSVRCELKTTTLYSLEKTITQR